MWLVEFEVGMECIVMVMVVCWFCGGGFYFMVCVWIMWDGEEVLVFEKVGLMEWFVLLLLILLDGLFDGFLIVGKEIRNDWIGFVV